MTNMKDIKTDISDIQTHLESLKLELSTVQANINGVLNRLNELEPTFDPTKEYTLQEAAILAFENPGWVFNPINMAIDESNQLKYKPENDCYFLNGHGERLKLSPQDLESKWHRIK